MLDQPYLWWKYLHIVSMVAWMAALLYLPRLFVYHATATAGGELSETLKIMERRLLRYIATPAMIATFFFGLMLFRYVDLAQAGWMHSKLLLVFVLAGFHGMMARWRKDFATDQNRRSAKFYRIANEVPTVALLLIVFLVVLKPF